MLRILFSGVRHAQLVARPFPKVGYSMVETGVSLERLGCRPQIPRPPKCQPDMSDFETFSMANVTPKRTGLPMVVYVSFKNSDHGPEIKVSKRYGSSISVGYWFTITVQDEPQVIGNTTPIKHEDVNLVKKWISLNKDLLIRYWEQVEDLDAADTILSLKKI